MAIRRHRMFNVQIGAEHALIEIAPEDDGERCDDCGCRLCRCDEFTFDDFEEENNG